jgi:Protein of unknown function (DUF3866)
VIRWRDGHVVALRRRWRGAIELEVALPVTPGEAASKPGAAATVRAVAYPALVGEPEPGDRVLLNVAAMHLGTGGYAFVVAIPDRLPPDREHTGGHVVKARYTPQQVMLRGVEETADSLAGSAELGGVPVVLADLHSALPAILAGALADRAAARVAYVMTDGGALPAWFSQTLDALGSLLTGVITVGQAFGGDLEAANVHTGLLAARHVLAADLVVVAPGPGTLGTGTPWGFSGTAVGEAVNATAALGGHPVGALRISDADPRPRHRGLSHHCLTAYGRVALAGADLVIPSGLPAPLAGEVRAALAALPAWHRVVEVDSAGLDAALRGLPIKLSTMGRDLDADHAYFLAAAAAGRHAAALSGLGSKPE